MTNLNNIPQDKLDSFCRKWSVQELSLFGSILTENFTGSSDVDILISFLPTANWTLFDHVDMKEDLRQIFGRRIDLVTKKAIEKSNNQIRKRSILDSAKRVYFTD